MFYVTNRWLGGTLTNFRTMAVNDGSLIVALQMLAADMRRAGRVEDEAMLIEASKRLAMLRDRAIQAGECAKRVRLVAVDRDRVLELEKVARAAAITPECEWAIDEAFAILLGDTSSWARCETCGRPKRR